ncbi:MAG TPA: cysteine-rich CWC family protein [Noviherbaspirillum sp.]|uniref:cysteine-rich CWC family protein n=1 Tax=Noviherbaspirillum sp. TaxID=1926288 RepID=UPI002D58DE07|nr:cysteine-rich CWC family protein [Noviherbaspirillum sp.]HYD94592.1 cysteine-rich CWC family protein [Noviherbaspirillum sp.]
MSTCAACGKPFTCGMADTPGDERPCWCAALPPLAPDTGAPAQDGDAALCFCPDCLRARVAAQQSGRSENR